VKNLGRLLFKATLVNKSIITNPLGEKMVKLEFVEEREMPGPLITSPVQYSEIAREIAPIVSQMMRTFNPTGKLNVPRVILFLNEEEWEMARFRPEIGEEVGVFVSDKGGLELRAIKEER